MLQLENITKAYGARKVLNKLNLEIEKGESVAILGPSGTGKTTLLNIIGTLDAPDEGSVSLNKTDILGLNEHQKTTFRNEQIGMVFQLHHLLPQLTLWENILVPTLPLKNKNNIEARAENLLKQTGIWEQRFQKPSELSGGECQRAALVRSLINQPSLLLADEPTGALDQENANILTDILVELNKNEGTALIVVTHSLELANKMDKTYKLINGQLQLISE